MKAFAKESASSGQVIDKNVLQYAIGAGESFIAEVEPGEIFEVETELNIGGHLNYSID